MRNIVKMTVSNGIGSVTTEYIILWEIESDKLSDQLSWSGEEQIEQES